MNSRKIIMFLILNFFITWSAWFFVIFISNDELSPQNPNYIVYGLGGLLGPVVGAFIAQKFYGTKEEFSQFWKSIRRFNTSIVWYAYVLVLPFLFSILAFFIHWIFTGSFLLHFEKSYFLILTLLPMMIIGGGLEELGWRGVLLPELLKKFNPTTATFIVSVLWTLWHIPLWFMIGTVQYGSNFGLFSLSLLCSSFLLSALYIKTRSIGLCVLLHAVFNANSAFFAQLPDFTSWTEPISLLVKLLLSFLIFFVVVKPPLLIQTKFK